jgi:hypothetical protein
VQAEPRYRLSFFHILFDQYSLKEKFRFEQLACKALFPANFSPERIAQSTVIERVLARSRVDWVDEVDAGQRDCRAGRFFGKWLVQPCFAVIGCDRRRDAPEYVEARGTRPRLFFEQYFMFMRKL